MSQLSAATLPDFSTLTVNVIGDVMLDEYLVGDTSRISPEAPVPVVRVEDRFSRPGGAANVAANCAALGAKVRLGGVVGNDAAGRQLRSLCEARGIDVSGLVALQGRATVCKQRVLGRGQQVVRLDWEEDTPVSASVMDRVLAVLGSADVWLVSDYAKGMLTASTLSQVMRSAGAAACPVVVDPKVRDFTLYRGATLLTPNHKELRLALGKDPQGEPFEDLIRDAQRLLEQCGAQALVVTRGEAGLSVVPAEGAPTHFEAHRRQVYDTTGAGDTVTAVVGMLVALGVSYADAGAWANLAAGLVVERLGTATLSISDLRAELGGGDRPLSVEEAQRRAEAWRQRGLRVVFTNGCFDLLHTGHVHLLREAARRGDKLIVGINSDASVARLKGAGRPVLPAAERAAMLGALQGVDAVTVFHEDTPLTLVQALRPHVLVKGADYRKDQVVGAAEVESWGGEVVLVPLVGERSTTELVASIRGTS